MRKFFLLLAMTIVVTAANAHHVPGLSHSTVRQLSNNEMAKTSRHALTKGHVDLASPAQALSANAEAVTPPASLETQKYRLSGYVFDGSSWQAVSNPLNIGWDGNDVYVQGFSLLLPTAWIKGTLDPATMKVSFAAQYYGTYQGYDDYFFPVAPVNQNELSPIDAVFNYNADAGTFALSQDAVCYILENSSDSEIAWFYQYDSQMTLVPDGDTVEVPDGLQTQEYALTGVYMGYDNQWFEGNPLSLITRVGIDGDDIYVQGLCSYLPLAWVKGHRQGTNYVIESGQYFGTFIYRGDAYQLYFMGCTPQSNDASPLTLTVDATTGVITAQQWYAISSSDEAVLWYDLIGNVQLSPIADVAATPATPEVLYYEYYGDEGFGYTMLNISATDTDGNPLLSDKLGYQLFCDYGNGAEQYIFAAEYYGFDDDLETIGYNFGDDINFMMRGELVALYNLGDGLQRLGVRSVYTGGGTTNYSDIGWYDVTANEKVEVTPPEGMETYTYTFTATDLLFGPDSPEEYSADVRVGFDGADVYIQGISKWLPEAWVKGTMTDDGTTTFEKHFLGYFSAWDINMEIVFNGATLAYDPDTDTFTSPEGFTSTSGYDLDGEHYEEDADVFVDVVITRAADAPAIPAAPQILSFESNGSYGYMLRMNIPLEDVDGNPIFASMLSYQLYCDTGGDVSPITLEASRYEFATDDMTVIPYLYTDYWEVMQGGTEVYVHADGIEQWQAIGAKTIYTGGGETHESPITWHAIPKTGIDTITTDEARSMQLYDVLGRRADSRNLTSGVYVSHGRKIVIR